ncbi:MAG: D-alanyl-D-alanine carboxypeptidase [Clostridiales bacterium]|jgi:D-alanyl-D-alanine carboxypeptidase (penicillin-binding protein 5/6)|nr:D-alanyl-D-alanine carboxypeptidase [Clostridiales bacterium]
MKRLSVVFLSLLIAAAPVRPAYAETARPDQIKEPAVKALGAVLMDYRTGRVLWGKNERAPMAMASTTKIMTAVLALESGRLDETCVASKRAAVAPPVKMGLSTGEKIKLSDLMYALMLESQNDAAVAIAEHIGGTVEGFCALMTEKAKTIGAMDTVFETPNGLDKGDHHSTAYDMALITRYALANPEFVKLINTKEKSFSSDKRSYSFNNKNRLLSEYKGANGVKTGFTGKAGHCFVGAAQRGDMELISVVLASGWGNTGKQCKWIDTKALLDYGFSNFKYRNIIQAGREAGSVPVGRSRAGEVACVFGEELTLPLRSDEDDIVVAEHLPEEVLAPVQAGEVLGEAEVIINGKLLTKIPLKAASDASRHDLKTSLEKLLNCAIWLSTRADIKVILPEF